MTKVIWKFPIQNEMWVDIPKGAQIIDLRMQYGDTLTIWAIVDTEAPLESRKFRIIGTGYDIPSDKYIGSFGQMNDQLIWHVFETTI